MCGIEINVLHKNTQYKLFITASQITLENDVENIEHEILSNAALPHLRTDHMWSTLSHKEW